MKKTKDDSTNLDLFKLCMAHKLEKWITDMEKVKDFLAKPYCPHTVTRKRLEEIVDELITRFDCECGLTHLQKTGIATVLTEKGDLEDLFMEFGITVD